MNKITFIFMLLFASILILELHAEERNIIDLERISNLSREEYMKMYYDIAIEDQTKPENFIITKDLALLIFKQIAQKYYDVSYTEDIVFWDIYEEYYIISGRENPKETGFRDRITVRNNTVTLILRKRDGAVISLFIER